MPIAADAITDVNLVIEEHGVPIRATYEYASGTSLDYDTMTWVASGTSFSGTAMMFAVNSDKGGTDFKWIEQGIVEINDTKLYVAGSLALSGTSSIRSIIDIRASGNTFDLIQRIPFTETGSAIYQKLFVRKRV